MNNDEFEATVELFLGKIRENLVVKAREYARGGDRLSNFNTGARIRSKSREEVLWGIATKHLVSVIEMVEDSESGVIPSQYMLDEKVGDLATYLTLLYASFQHRINNESK